MLRKAFGKYKKGTERRCLYEEILTYHGEAKKQQVDRRLRSGELELEPYRQTGNHVIVEYQPLDEASSALYSLLPVVQALPDGRLEDLGLAEEFSYPKPVDLVKTVVRSVTPKDKKSIVVDLFSGSATTADAVMQLNAEDGGDRRYILAQLPERLGADDSDVNQGYKTIDEVGCERIRRAAAAIRSETGADIDYGFKLFRLEEPAGKTLDALETFDPSENDVLFTGDYVSKFELNGSSGREVILATWLVQDGFMLGAKTQEIELVDYSLPVCGDSAYVIDTGLTSEDVMSLVSKIENGSLDVSRVVVFGYSVRFSVMHELKKNLSVLKSGRSVEVLERY